MLSLRSLTKFLFSVALVLACAAGSLSAATSGSVSPVSLASDSLSNITITVTGLPAAGTSVLIERILDVSGNGAVDAGEPLVQSFLVTDGQAVSVGGVRNPNIPGDDDGASNSQITTHISLLNSPESGLTAGSYVIRISSPTSAFTAFTKTFAVTQPSFGQSVRGQVSKGGSPVSYAIVTAFVPPDGEYAASVVSDISGNYTLNVPAGNYMLAAVGIGSVGSMSPSFALSANQTLTGKNLVLANATCTIAGKVQDVSGTPTLKGVQLSAMSTAGGVVTATSDASGNYTLSVLPGQWNLVVSDGSVNPLGYLRPKDPIPATTTTGNTTTLNVPLTPATSMVYGTVKTPSGVPMSGILVESADDPDNGGPLYSSNVKTDADGKYFLGMTGTTGWRVRVNEQAALTPYIMPDNQWLNPIANLAIPLNFTLNQVTAHLQGTVTKNGTPVTGAPITAYVNSNDIEVSTTTDSSGYFDLGVMGEMWTLDIDGDWAQANGLVAPGLSFTVSNNQTISGIDWKVLASTGTITGTVKDPFNSPVTTGLWVYAYTTINGTYYEVGAESDPSGNYSLKVLSGNDWTVGGDGCGDDQTVSVNPSAQANLIQSAITYDPNDQTVPVGGNATFSAGVNAPSPTIQWQRLPVGADWDTGWIDLTNNSTYTGANTANLTVSSITPAMTGDQFRCVVGYTFNGTTTATNTSDSAELVAITAHLLGRVTNGGVGIAGLQIGAGHNGTTFRWVDTLTDADGYFDLGVTEDGQWNISVDSNYTASHNVLGPNLQVTVTNSQNVPNIAIPIVNATGTISGSVKDANNNPVTNTGVWANAIINGNFFFGYRQTDASGSFSIPVIDGTWNVGVNSPHNFAQQSVSVTGSAVTNFAPPAVVAHAFGTVTKNGVPVPGATVLGSQGPLWVSATTGPDGSFDLGVTATGFWSISLEHNYANANNLVRTMHWVEVNTNISGPEIQIADGTGTISGSVKDANNNPLTNVGVHAFAMVGGIQFYAYANTDSSGLYSLPTINGTWDVNVLYPGFNGKSVSVTGSSQANFTPVTAHFQGTMTKNGNPVPYMSILAVPQDGDLSNIVSTTTDANGNYDLGVSAGTWAIRLSQMWANMNNLVGPSIYKTVDSTPTTITGIAYEVLDGDATIYGNVKDANNNPVAGTNVWASTSVNGVEYNGSAHTDANGNYSFPALSGYVWTVGAVGPGYQAKQVTASGYTQVDFTPTNIRGIVLGLAQMEGVQILATQGSEWVTTTTNMWGWFDVVVPAAGSWNVTIAHDYANSHNLIRTTRWVEAVDGQTTWMGPIFVTNATGTIFGSVWDSVGDPLANTGVHAFANLFGTEYYAFSLTDSTGGYTLPSIDGTWSVSVLQSGYDTQTIVGRGSSQVDFAPTVANVYGLVTTDGWPAANVSIIASQGSARVRTISDSNGNYQLGVTNTGDWDIDVDPGFATSHKVLSPALLVAVGSGQDIQADIPMRSSCGTISGSVRDANDAPLANTGVYGTALINGTSFSAHALTDANGSYYFPVARGTWTVGVEHPGFSGHTVDVFASASVFFSLRTIPSSASGGGYIFSNFAGAPSSFTGSADGAGNGARFSSPSGVVADASGNIYVSDSANNLIRKVTSFGVVTTFAGSFSGSADGTGTAARFSNPQGMDADAAGNLYIAEAGNHRIRKVTPEGGVAAFSGSAGFAGSADGSGVAAFFNQPSDVAVDAAGNVYVADSGNHAIRKISTSGTVSTLAGTMGVKGSLDGSSAKFQSPQGVAVDAAGNVYVADTANCLIRKITSNGTVSTFAGSAFTGSADRVGRAVFTGSADISGRAGFSGSADFTSAPLSADGTGASAAFSFPTDIDVDASGNLFVTDSGTGKIRKITPGGVVTTLGGTPDGFFFSPLGIAAATGGNLFVADAGNNRIAVGMGAQPVIATTSPLPAGAVGATYSQAFSATGGTSPYTWAVASGTLPAGLALGSNGTLSGKPSSATTANFTIRVTGSDSISATADFSLTITSPSATWQGTNFTPADVATGRTTLTADFDRDGMANLLEYAFGKNPKAPDASGIVPNVSGGKMQISFKCDAACTDITYTVQASPNLTSSWSDIAESVGGAATVQKGGSGCAVSDSGTALRTVTVTEATAFTGGKRFLRVKVTSP